VNIIDQLLGNEAGNFIQFIKYAISGGIATITHILVFHLAAWKLFYALQANDWFVKILKLPIRQISDSARARNSMKANAVAFILSNFVAYVINIYWVFVPGRHHWIVQIGLFYVVSGVAIGVGTAVMVFLIRRFGMLTTHAFGANIFAGLMINYGMRKFFIFNG
jgi:putative flippase GtrA